MTRAAHSTTGDDDWTQILEHRWREYERLASGTSWMGADYSVGDIVANATGDEPIVILGPIAVVW